MLDFVKAMEISERICAAYESKNIMCSKCTLCSEDGICFFRARDKKIDWTEVERRLIEWDKAHPEPKYPTWEEWQEENFQNAYHRICPMTFGPMEEVCTEDHCYDCRQHRIPADIAKKLGIQPKEGT